MLLLIVSCKEKSEKQDYTSVSANEEIEKFYAENLTIGASYLDSLSFTKDVNKKIEYYKKARKNFKSIEPIMASIDKNNYSSLNAPNILKVEEEDPNDIKIKKPFGFQVIEELLHEETIDTSYVNNITSITKSRFKLLENNAKINFKDYHIIWLIKDQIVRIATTGITGFDSPVLGQSLLECQYTYNTLEKIITLKVDKFESKPLLNEFVNSIAAAKESLNTNFESFDRYHFIKNHIHPQLKILNKIQEDWQIEFPFTLAIDNNVESLFSKETFNLNYFSSTRKKTTDSLQMQRVKLGEQLFNDTSFSKSNTISCATCHIQEKAYTDGLKIAKGVTRNSPTLLYAALQKGFFYDKRSGDLEGQIVSVINNDNEFHSTLNDLEKTIKQNPQYVKLFEENYKTGVTQENARNAIAAFIRSLIPFNSKFDRNINGIENTLTDREINGFNLFTGKAACATCHFAPVFNGTVPTRFKESEMEAIGVPEQKDTINAQISKDLGRYYFYNTEERKHFFKTPTVRNVALTAPYMHNGVYNTLEEVVDFYNRGGGQGIGIDLPLQTLPPDPLNLTKKEQEDLVLFLKTLTDKAGY